MSEKQTPNLEGAEHKCKACKRGHEHLSSILPFSVIEKIADKPLKIKGLAMTTGMSRNLNIYTSEELQKFTSKLVNAPVYIEHVSVPNGIGKVTKADWDGHSLWYEAEIYDEQTAEKIRKGIIQHVSVGADYEAIDLVDGKIPHGLHNAELSLVAVPGIPETNINILEKLLDTKFTQVLKTTENQEIIKEKLAQTEEKLAESNKKLTEAQKTIEDLHKQQSSNSLLKNPPKTIAVSEVAKMVESILPSHMVQRSWSLGPQRMCQELRRVIQQLEQKAGGS